MTLATRRLARRYDAAIVPALWAGSRQEFFDRLAARTDRRALCGTVLSTHWLDMAGSLCDRVVILQLDASTHFTAHPDAYTTVEVVADAQDDSVVNFRGAFSIVPSFAWSWQTFNLELGLGYGNFNVPGVNFMINRRTLIPTFDMYWTF